MAEICIIDENFVKKYTNVNGAVDSNRIYQANPDALQQDCWSE